MSVKKSSKKPELVRKGVDLPAPLVAKVERSKGSVGQNFKWAPYLLHLIERDVKRA